MLLRPMRRWWDQQLVRSGERGPEVMHEGNLIGPGRSVVGKRQAEATVESRRGVQVPKLLGAKRSREIPVRSQLTPYGL